LSNIIRRKVLSFEEYWLASKAGKRRGLTPGAARSLVNNGTLALDDRHHAADLELTTTRVGRKVLYGAMGGERPRIGTVPNERKIGLSAVERANSAALPGLTERAMIEAAIQLGLITPEQAEALVEKGRTLGEWMVEQRRVETGKPREGKQKLMDRLGVLALLLFNLVIWVGFGLIVLRVLRSL
jgi:hypothetical protein